MLSTTLKMVILKTVFGVNCAKIPTFTMVQVTTTNPNWSICANEFPFAKIYIAATPPKQLCPIMTKAANPI